MNSKTLLSKYFRQIADLGIPDPILSAKLNLVELFGESKPKFVVNNPVKKPVQPVSVVSPVVNVEPPKEVKPVVHLQAAPEVGGTDIFSRLSKLKPLDTVHSTLGVKPFIKAGANRNSSSEEVTAKNPRLPIGERRAALKELMIQTRRCQNCPFGSTRKNIVFGSGNAAASIMVIGEAPGVDDDEQGLPFVSRAGQLLTDMLAAIKLDRKKDIFITNVLKCRPTEDASPEGTEVLACMPILVKQIDILKPKVILLLGSSAAHAVLDNTNSIQKLRSEVYSYKGIPVFITYHPAELLRNLEFKRPAWEDLKKFQSYLKEIGINGLSE